MAAMKLDSEQRKEQIARAALGLISRGGMRALSMAAVARQLGLVPSAIYRHFRNKQEMLDAVFESIHAALRHNVELACASSPEPLERLQFLLRNNLAMVRDFGAIPRVILSEGVWGSQSDRKNKVYGIIRGYLEAVEAIVRDGQQQGRIKENIDSHTIAVMFWGLLPPAGILWFVSDGRFDVTRHVEQAWKMFSESIRR